MKGMPAVIATREDLQNLFALAQENKVDKAKLAEKVRGLLATQYQRVPVIAQSDDTVTTRYFPEVGLADTTIEGYEIIDVAHIEAESDDGEAEPGDGEAEPGSETAYDKTVVSCSTTPESGMETLTVYRQDNYLTRNGFDIAEINYIMGVLCNE